MRKVDAEKLEDAVRAQVDVQQNQHSPRRGMLERPLTNFRYIESAA
jgi:hypothetical protein